MLKLASLSLAAILALASPALADKKKCYPPETFKGAERLEGKALDKFREHVIGLPSAVDLVLIIQAQGVAIGFVKGCAASFGTFGPVAPAAPAPKPKGDDGSV